MQTLPVQGTVCVPIPSKMKDHADTIRKSAQQFHGFWDSETVQIIQAISSTWLCDVVFAMLARSLSSHILFIELNVITQLCDTFTFKHANGFKVSIFKAFWSASYFINHGVAVRFL